MTPRNPNARKRYRMSLLLDAYGALLTEKQRSFLRQYYEEDYSFGEIAEEYGVSRQAIFDAVKHGEASLEEYERVMGLVEGGVLDGERVRNLARRLAACAKRARELTTRDGATAAGAEARALADELEELVAELKRPGADADEAGFEETGEALEEGGEERASAARAGKGSGGKRAVRPAPSLMSDGPEID